MTHRNETLHT